MRPYRLLKRSAVNYDLELRYLTLIPCELVILGIVIPDTSFATIRYLVVIKTAVTNSNLLITNGRWR